MYVCVYMYCAPEVFSLLDVLGLVIIITILNHVAGTGY